MIIIIEGPDGSGKSTLASMMSNQTGYPILHRSKPKSEEEKKAMLQMYWECTRVGNAIFDRCWYSELVYGPIKRDASCLSYEQMYALERRVAKKGGLIIYCRAPLQVLQKRCQLRGEDYIALDHELRQVIDAYDKLMLQFPHHIPVTTYEFN